MTYKLGQYILYIYSVYFEFFKAMITFLHDYIISLMSILKIKKFLLLFFLNNKKVLKVLVNHKIKYETT